MTQRRMPSGQGPARRPGPTGRPGGRSGGRLGSRDVAASRAAAGRTASTRSAVRAADPARSTSRPAAARRVAATGSTKRTVAPRPRALTGRATVLLVVLVALALGYTYPVRVYLEQESQIGRMESAQAAQQQEINKLAEEAAKWQDREYVRIKARERLFYVRPGEVPLVVIHDPVGAARDAGTDPDASAAPDRWYDTLWASIAAANAEPRP